MMASARRVGFYMVVNSSRKALGQTGMGHYCPVAGVNLKRGYALILEVARFKYPSFWVKLEKLYESMKDLDAQSNNSRGFSLMTRDFRQFSEICRISDDYVSMKNTRVFMENDFSKVVEIARKEFVGSESEEEKTIKIMYKILSSLVEDFNYLLAYYLFDLSVRLEYKDKNKDETTNLGEKLFQILVKDLEQVPLTGMVQKMINKYRPELEKHPVFVLIGDFQPLLMTSVVTMLLLSFPKAYYDQAKFEAMSQSKTELRSANLPELLQELKRLRRTLGIMKD